jgi:hypothetical protein
MHAKNEIDQAIRIDRKIDPVFPLDLIVRTPEHIAGRVEQGDSFLKEILSKGKVLYEKGDLAVGSKGRVRLSGRKTSRSRKSAVSR